MIINFRQGIVSYPTTGGIQQFLQPTGNYVSINTVNGVVDVALAHRTTNYLHTETASVSNAWGPFTTTDIAWLYWDIDTITGARTFGYTIDRPVVQGTAPLNPVTDQHWFDTSLCVMKVYTGSRWQEKIRVFAAEYDPTNHTFMSVSVLSNQQRFDGTQVGLQGTKTATGRIIVDNAGRPVTNQYNLFFTTEDDFFINGSPINTIRLEANILTASPVENVAEYQVVTFTDFDRVALATYDNLQTTAVAIAVQDVLKNDVGSFVVQGIITNPLWNWTQVGAELWVSTGGALVEYDPHVNDAITYNVGKAPVGRVISRTSIIFDQGLGGKGDKGDSALSGNGIGEAATMLELGKVKLTVAPADPGSPYAVETSDPRMNDARVPLQHEQPASTVIPETYGVTINGNLQTTLVNMENTKLNKTGDAMTGVLLLAGNPSNPLAAVPKQYADLFVPLSQKGSANGVATLDATGKITMSQMPPITLTNTYVVANEVEMLALSAQTGDLAVRTDENTTYILKGTSAQNLADWQELLTKPDGVVWIDVAAAAGSQGIVTAGGPVTSTGTISISLANDLAALEALNTTGVAHRVGNDTWELKAVDLAAGGSVVTGILPAANGGTGLSSPVGYIKGNGSTFIASATIPAADVVGSVGSASTVQWSGVLNTPVSLVGYGITDAYTKTQTNNLTWNWSSITGHPSTLIGYGITDVYSKTEVDNSLLQKANNATTLAGYGITDASHVGHSHLLDDLTNVNVSSKATGDVLSWNGLNWSPLAVSNAILPTVISNKTLDATNTYTAQDALFTIVDNTDSTKKFNFQASTISPNTTRAYALPDEDGQFVLANGYGAYGTWSITAAAATSVAWSGVTSTPTSLAGYSITDAYTKTQTDALVWNWSAITNAPTTLAGYGIADAYTKTQTDALVWNWSAITSRPTTLAGYGITDAYTKTQTDAKTWNWSAITNTPITLAGYGITDAASATHNHDTTYVKLTDVGNTVASLDFTGKVPATELPDYVKTHTYTANNDAGMTSLTASRGDMVLRTDLSKTFILVTEPASLLANWTELLTPTGPGGTITSVGLSAPAAGITVTGSPITSSGTFTLALADDLEGLENISGTGFVVRDAVNTYTTYPTVPMTAVSGTLGVDQGGTGQTTAPAALVALGATPLNGVGANGTWNIDITGRAATATTVIDGVYTTGLYSDPSWIVSLDPSKVVSTWTGSTNINTVGSTVMYGTTAQTVTGVTEISSTATSPVLSYDSAINDGGKILFYVSCDALSTASIVEVFVTTDAAGNVHFAQTSVGSSTSTFSAAIIGNTVTIYVNSPSADLTMFKYSATLFVS